MTRKASRRFTSYSKPNDDSYYKEQMVQQQQQNQHQYQQEQQYQSNQRQQSMSDDNGEVDNDSVIADMAQGFIQAQAKMSDNHSTVNNLEIALLLQKCNDQLEEIRRSAKGTSADQSVTNQSNSNSVTQDVGQQNQCVGGQGNTKQQGNQMPAQDLQGLLASILQGKDNNQNNKTESSTKPSNRNNNNSNSNESGEDQKKTTQTVSQVLAQAQYELANELENSLKKLKQVIAESEKIASNISDLLGEEKKTKS